MAAGRIASVLEIAIGAYQIIPKPVIRRDYIWFRLCERDKQLNKHIMGEIFYIITFHRYIKNAAP